MCLKEHQQRIDIFKECILEKTDQVSKSQEALEKTNAELQEKTLKLQETEEMLLSVGKEVNETKLQRQTLCQLVEQLTQTLSAVEAARLDLTQKLDSSLSKMNTVIKERDALKETEKILQMEVNHLKESLTKSRALDQQYLKNFINNEKSPRKDIKQFCFENLKEKYLTIKFAESPSIHHLQLSQDWGDLGPSMAQQSPTSVLVKRPPQSPSDRLFDPLALCGLRAPETPTAPADSVAPKACSQGLLPVCRCLVCAVIAVLDCAPPSPRCESFLVTF
ncbi:centromere-associated protein E-like [Vombatus ursinus]|uniref:centromere-associated protein E-like n=1 Tax=Vombatus ursinus TaxID=29139 RepID=UPI000FFD8331|nr:centromere-associated protein E-like [Vombatus ursinus]